jgi:hypothetical protein
MDMTRAKYADAVHNSECHSTALLAYACGSSNIPRFEFALYVE